MQQRDYIEIRELKTDEVECISGAAINFSFVDLDFTFNDKVVVVKDNTTGTVYWDTYR